MEIKRNEVNGVLELGLVGRLDTSTAPELAAVVDEIASDVKNLVIDLGELEYISSAGLRVILTAQKKMNKQGEMLVKNANEVIMEIFEITGFVDILNIE